MAHQRINCCKDCPERHLGCHGECEKYQMARKEADEAIERRRVARSGMYGVYDSLVVNQVFKKAAKSKNKG